ncbi:hypothetical protein [Sandarakinorhabdus sp. DWP1-3-1]|uniref:hypothetical protein n=1 Tax=Sandarakinorhabdus sp. DWP1-3-1 TaxID=2804627 RepID=UPI003CEB1AD1
MTTDLESNPQGAPEAAPSDTPAPAVAPQQALNDTLRSAVLGVRAAPDAPLPAEYWADAPRGSIDPATVSGAQIFALVDTMLSDPINFDPLPGGDRRPRNMPRSALPPEWREAADKAINAAGANGNAEAEQAIIDETAHRMVKRARFNAGPPEQSSLLHGALYDVRQTAVRLLDETEALTARRDAITGYDLQGRPRYVLPELERAKLSAEIQAKNFEYTGRRLDAVRRVRQAIAADYAERQKTVEGVELEKAAQERARQLQIEERAREINARRPRRL